ncbi:ATPase component of various ABC-type transport systems with duplicated ATPase domain [Desulfosporosinus orientis DSM 765]|uniref:ATPase component of various ABC-type transport systems with duplicated ATPase domain n=1 Tax=Desulfosporosinus orientis (strain ATCC 19365 / DSM 765 / NCIMB 8382 / VKM B-1628 / Singapore I) TaxID=768706 RepID=G7WFJ0_DESOD|nr:ATP-binding cassette domain-containing protein [Desulfosporosinus orientis]AET68433.1 ATPase component of various ABC-type transport systems with duplicated ATPase domain [Desulfosporosinus orientis DSM 765]
MLLEVKGISKNYHAGFWGQRMVKAVSDVSFTINKGEIFGLIGESGCGKSTLTRIILGLLKPTRGSVFYRDRDLTKLKKGDWQRLRREIQVVFQHPQSMFNPRRKIYFSCAEPIRLFKMAENKGEEERMVAELMERVGLSEDQLKKYPHELSGGQAQRLSIIRALSLNPRLLICDEPTSMLDVSVQAQILNLLTMNKDHDLAMLYISHDLEVIRAICQRVAVMRQGEIVEMGTVQEVFESPRHDYTKHLLASNLEV